MYEYIKSLLKLDVFNKGRNTLIQNFTNILQNGTYSDFKLICRDEKVAKIMIENDLFWTNIQLIVNKAKDQEGFIDCIRNLSKINKNYILNQKEKIFDYYPEITLEYIKFLNECNADLISVVKYLIENNIIVDYNLVLEYLLTLPIGKSIVMNNLDYFIMSNRRLLKLKSILTKNDINSNIDEVINNNENYIIEEVIYDKTGLLTDDLQKENLLDELKKIFKYIFEVENASYNNIEKIGSGNFSDVYKIGTKILKIAKEKDSISVPNNKLFLPHIFSANIKSGIDNRQLINIEVTDIVDTKNVNSENLYQIYKQLRELGYMWGDCRLTNIGRLLKDTKVTTFDSDGNKIIETMKKGEIVILDKDYVYTEEQFRNLDKRSHEKLNKIYNYNLLKSFEERYQNERNIVTKII